MNIENGSVVCFHCVLTNFSQNYYRRFPHSMPFISADVCLMVFQKRIKSYLAELYYVFLRGTSVSKQFALFEGVDASVDIMVCQFL